MDRLSLPAAALAATALLVFTPADARGQSDPVTPASDPAATEPSTPATAPAASDEGSSSDTTATPPSSEPAAAETATTPSASQEATPAATVDPAPTATPTVTVDIGAPPPPDAGSDEGGSTGVPVAEESGDAFALAQPVSQSSSTTAELRSGPPISPPALPERGGPGALPAVPVPTPAAGERRAGTRLKRALPAMERDLRQVHAQIDDLRRRLDQGTPAPAVSIINLRLSLESLAPALVALDGRLDARELSPAMERQVRRLRARLAGTQASAAGLLVDLERSGAYGLELGLLVRELESFTALDLGPIASPGGPAPRPQPSAALTPHAAVQPAPAVARALPPAPSAVQAAPQSRPPAAPDAVSPDDDPAPWSLPSGSVSPGSALSAAGVAALAALLIGLALSRLRVALAVAPSRRYAVMFLSPLERPG